MYQSAYLSLEFSLNWFVGNDRCWVLILKFRHKFKFAFHEKLTLLMNRGSKIFQLPGFTFSRTLPLFKQELPEKSRFGVVFDCTKGKIRKYSLKKSKQLETFTFLELAHQGLFSGKFWRNRFFQS